MSNKTKIFQQLELIKRGISLISDNKEATVILIREADLAGEMINSLDLRDFGLGLSDLRVGDVDSKMSIKEDN